MTFLTYVITKVWEIEIFLQTKKKKTSFNVNIILHIGCKYIFLWDIFLKTFSGLHIIRMKICNNLQSVIYIFGWPSFLFMQFSNVRNFVYRCHDDETNRQINDDHLIFVNICINLLSITFHACQILSLSECDT